MQYKSLEQLVKAIETAKNTKTAIEINGIKLDYSKKKITIATAQAETLILHCYEIAKAEHGKKISESLKRKKALADNEYHHGKRAYDLEFLETNKAEIVADIRSGKLTLSEIGAKHNTSRQTIAKYKKIIEAV